MSKYRKLRERVSEANWIQRDRLFVPESASLEDLARVHSPDYLHRAESGLLTDFEIRRLGFPWSPAMVERSRRSSGATVGACLSALEFGYGVNLAGGTHHAYRDHGEGYCLLNDSVVAARAMQARGRVRRVVILDADVHQGNGTASLVQDDPSIFAFSIHSENNYPLRKERSDLDVGLPDGTEDMAYLDALEAGLRQSLETARADLAIYLAGADPYFGDRLGRLALTKQGLLERDRMVLDFCSIFGIPVAVSMAGGYAPNVDDIVDIHFRTVEEVAARAHRFTP